MREAAHRVGGGASGPGREARGPICLRRRACAMTLVPVGPAPAVTARRRDARCDAAPRDWGRTLLTVPPTTDACRAQARPSHCSGAARRLPDEARFRAVYLTNRCLVEDGQPDVAAASGTPARNASCPAWSPAAGPRAVCRLRWEASRAGRGRPGTAPAMRTASPSREPLSARFFPGEPTLQRRA